MADLMTKIRKALGFVRDLPGQTDSDHEDVLRRLETQRIRLGRIDAVLESNRASKHR